MADPISIASIVEGSISLILQCGSVAKTLNDMAGKYKQARVTIMSMVQEVDTIELAWSRIKRWSKDYADSVKDHEETLDTTFFERLERSMECGTIVMSALQEDLSQFAATVDNLSFMQRSKAVWNTKGLQDHQHRIRGQVLATSLLLQVLELPTPKSRTQLVAAQSSGFRKSDDSAYSIVPSRMSSRLSSRRSMSTCATKTDVGDTNMIYRRLSFENELFTAAVYKRSYRSPLVRALFQAKAGASSRRRVRIDTDDIPTDEAGTKEIQRAIPLPLTRLPNSYLHNDGDALCEVDNPRADGQFGEPSRSKSAIRSHDRQSQLHTTARGPDNGEMIELLVSRGANLEERDSASKTSLQMACQSGSRENVRTLLRLGALVAPTQPFEDSPLGIATICHHDDIADDILANVYMRHPYRRRGTAFAEPAGAEVWSLLYWQSFFSSVLQGPSVDKDGNQAFHYLALFYPIATWTPQKNFDLIFMRDSNADINAPNDAGETPVYLAAARRHESVVTSFLENQAESPTGLLLERLKTIFAKSEDACQTSTTALRDLRHKHAQILSRFQSRRQQLPTEQAE